MIIFAIIVIIVVGIFLWKRNVQKKIDLYWHYRQKYPEAVKSFEYQYCIKNLSGDDLKIKIGSLGDCQLLSEEHKIIEKEFKKQIEGDHKRKAYYYSYVTQYHSNEILKIDIIDPKASMDYNIKKLAVRNISHLDRYINATIKEVYFELQHKYPKALELFKSRHEDFYEFQIVSHKDEIIKLHKSIKKKIEYYEKIKAECPNLKSFISTYGLNSDDELQLIQNVIAKADLAKQFEKYLTSLKIIKTINKNAANTWSEKPIFSWKTYVFNLGTDRILSIPIRTYFLHSITDNVIKHLLERLKKTNLSFNDEIQDKTITVISNIEKQSKFAKCYIFNDEITDSDGNVIEVSTHLFFKDVIKYLENDSDNSIFYSMSSFVQFVKSFDIKLCDFSLFIISPLIRCGDEIKICKRLLGDTDGNFPHINFISIHKELSKEEIEEINRKRDEELQKIESTKNDFQLFSSKLSSWDKLYNSLPYFSFYYYYPTTCDWEANHREWKIRNLVWDFKFNPVNRNIEDYDYTSKEIADDEIIANLRKLLFGIFDHDSLKKITFVCLPASKKDVHERRYANFSKEVCDSLGMINGYKYVKILQDASGAKHLGGEGIQKLEIDNKFFKNSIVILFDDIITTGKSMIKFKGQLESAGALVLGGISIGKTRHERQSTNPIDEI